MIFQLKLKFNKTWKNIKKKTANTAFSVCSTTIINKERERETERNKENHDFIKTSLQMSKDELDAANEFADQKNEKIIRDIIDPTPGLS